MKISIVFFLVSIVVVLEAGFFLPTSNAEETKKSATTTPPDPEYNGKPLSYWLEHQYQYGFGGRQTNSASREALLQSGSNAVPLLLNWIAKPEGGGWSAPDYAVEGFEVLGPVSKPAVPDLIKIIGLNQDYPDRALVFIGKEAVPPLADKLVQTLLDTNNPIFFGGMRMEVRRDSGFYIRERILGVLSRLGTNAEAALPALIQIVTTNQPAEFRWWSEQNPYTVLVNVGRNHEDILIPILLEQFNNPKLSQFKRGQVADAISIFGTNQARVFLPVLIAALSENKTNDGSRIQMGAALAVMGSNQPDVLVPVFLTALSDKNNGEVILCNLAGDLDRVAHNQPDIVVPALMAAYTNCTVEGRCAIAGLLAGFGSRSRSLVPLLMTDSRSREIPINPPDWKIGLASAAKRIAPDLTNTLSPMIEDLQSNEGGIQQRMIRGFGDLGTNGVDAVPALLVFLTNNTTQIRCDAIEALNAIGVKSEEYICNLSRLVSDTNYFVAHYSQSALCTLAADSQLAFNTVLKDAIAAQVEHDVQEQAKWRLVDISRKNPKFLLNCLDNPDPAVRSGALVVFYPLNQCVRESFDKLFRMSHDDPDAVTRTLADTVFQLQLRLQ
jgi:HEAT repeat protein